MAMLAPGRRVVVLQEDMKRESGRKAQLGNIAAGRSVAAIVRTTLGPRAMLKMLLDPMGGIVVTNDGNAILREIDVNHPGARSLIELCRTSDEEVGDGTTSVIILAGELLCAAEPFLRKNTLHPSVIVGAYNRVLDFALAELHSIATPIDVKNDNEMLKLINSCLSTKFASRFGNIVSNLAMEACRRVSTTDVNGKRHIDIKRYAKVEKIPGGDITDSCVLDGVILNKDIIHPRMSRRIEKPKILLLDCTLEYKKGESQTSVEITEESGWQKLLEQEELEVKKFCDDIIATGCNLVLTEKGVSDLAQHFLVKAGISCIRRIRKSDANRVARVTGATICNRTDEVNTHDIGTKCALFEIKKIGDEYFTFLVDCEEPKACSIMLRGGSKDVLNEIERNLQDALSAARNIMIDGKLLPGGGAVEMELSARLALKARDVPGSLQWPFAAAAAAFEIIPKTLAQNSGANVIKVITELKAKHALRIETSKNFGVNGVTGEVCDVTTLGIYDSIAVKKQIIKTAIEASSMLLRIDDVLSGIKNPDKETKASMHSPPME